MIRLVVLVLTIVLSAVPRADAAEGSRTVAMNLSKVNDWSAQQPFLDVMKTARRWIGHKPRQWGGVSHAELEARGVLDEHGWPTEIPGDLSSIGTLVMTDLPAEADIYAGRYVLMFDGQGIVEVAGSVSNVRYGDGRVAFDFTPGGAVIVKIQRSDRRKTGDYVRNISIVREEHLQAWQDGALFNPDWLRHMRGFTSIRFMNWMKTNDSTQSAWANRPRVEDFTYTRRGVPLEIMIALANELNADPWFNMPHLGDEGYNRAFAEMVKARLKDGLRVYVEYSNEVWNWQFDQTEWADEQARARWGQQHRGHEFYGMKTAWMAQLWSEVFADERDRLINVLATHTGWLGLERAMLEAPLWVAEDPARNRPPHDHVDAYAVTGYFGHSLGRDKQRDMVKGWIRDSRAEALRAADAAGLSGTERDAHVMRHQYDAATVWAMSELLNGARTGNEEGSLTDLLNRVLPYHLGVARRHGLDLIMYEGGTHVVGIGAQVDDDDLTAFFTHLNYTPEMAALYERLIEGWFALGGGTMALYSDVLVPTKWGSWGHLRHLGDQNPRWDVIAKFKSADDT